MGNFKEKLFGLIDNSVDATMGLVDTINGTLGSIDWNLQFNSLMEMKDSLLQKSNDLLDEFNELMKQVKNNLSDFEVIVPFDETLGEKFETKVEDGKLTVEVSFEDENTTRSNKTTVKIPENCDVEKMTTKVNALAKTMTVIIPKIVVEPKEEKKEEGFKLKHHATPRKKVAEPSAETHDAESKLLRKFRENARATKVVTPRAANGRFTKRTPKAE